MSDVAPDLYDSRGEDQGVRRHLGVIRRVTGYAPSTCPWRTMYDPLVREAIHALDHEESGNLAVAIGADPPAILVDAIGVFKRALEATRLDDQKIAAEKARRERAST